jgi:hypothetical protein
VHVVGHLPQGTLGDVLPVHRPHVRRGGHVTHNVVDRHLVAGLRADGLERALAQAEAGFRDVLQRLQLIHIDACHWLMTAGQQQVPDVVYLDPMFPPRDKTAKVKKDMALLHRLLGSAQDLH